MSSENSTFLLSFNTESLCYGNADTVDLYSPHFLIFGVQTRVSVQGVKPLGGHFACLCRNLDFYKAKNILLHF